ncbi:hypothetical protein FNL56_13395 [Tardiphaga sp. vice304]|uniref:hypothetical protein n=1 Tax=Tardiphaga sp. vice304 TaxID=2592817 RepID=UPI001163DCBD|nr:hypothetical protein [Tardiphaga sp. vice304]QDM26995.1 hypothetical protein FNL56_13395 [Tardiphaga sp. vice304]
MPTPFEIAAAMNSAAVDTVYGEAFQCFAMAAAGDVDGPRQADPARDSFTVTGGFLAPSHSVLPHARGSVQDDNAHKVAISVPRVSFDNRLMVWPLRPGDRVVRLKTGETFEVAKALPDGVLRTMFSLTARKRT